MSFKDINTLVADSLICDPDFCQPLAHLVYEKTQGNAFFIHEFLKYLYRKELLLFDAENGKWRCRVSEISTLCMTDNVVELMIDKLNNLSADTREALKLAACIGNRFNLKTLSVICQQSQPEILTHLWQAMEVGLIEPQDYNYEHLEILGENKSGPQFAFQHDRIQQAVYSLIAGSDRPALHYHIGQLLMADIGHMGDNIFDIVDHLNLGVELLVHPVGKNKSARLNLQAGQKAKSAVAYRAACKYFTAGIGLLATESWQDEYSLTLALYEEASTTAALTGNFDRMGKWSQSVFQNATSVLDTVITYETIIYYADRRGDGQTP